MVENILSYQILRTNLRDYFIKKVKAPLRKVLILAANRIPVVDKGNTLFKNTHTLIDIFKQYSELDKNDDRKEMMEAAFKIFLMEIEHDVYYRDRFNWFLEEIIKAILRGGWEERTNGQPDAPLWIEQKPYGGKYSIMRHIKYSEDVVIHGGKL